MRHAALTLIAILAASAAACGDPPRDAATPSAPPAIRPTSASAANPTPYPASNSFASLETYTKSIADFHDFPVVWLGASYDSDGDGVGDMPLRSAYPTRSKAFTDRRTGAAILPPETFFGLSYGDCVIQPEAQSCAPPVDIAVYPPIEPCSRFSGGEGVTSVRGVEATIFNRGSLRIKTADFIVTISVTANSSAERLARTTRIAEHLVGANAEAGWLAAATDFRPPSAITPTACPPFHPTAPSGDVHSPTAVIDGIDPVEPAETSIPTDPEAQRSDPSAPTLSPGARPN